jgi:hypothetical protein
VIESQSSEYFSNQVARKLAEERLKYKVSKIDRKSLMAVKI